jgi:hypothetical protein
MSRVKEGAGANPGKGKRDRGSPPFWKRAAASRRYAMPHSLNILHSRIGAVTGSGESSVTGFERETIAR